MGFITKPSKLTRTKNKRQLSSDVFYSCSLPLLSWCSFYPVLLFEVKMSAMNFLLSIHTGLGFAEGHHSGSCPECVSVI